MMKLTLCNLPMGFSGPVWFLLLAVTYPGTVQGKVVNNFQPCQQFFKDGIAPQGFENNQNKDSMVKICQMYKNAYHFATLYRTDLRIPVYSAYTYINSNPDSKPCRPGRWFIEPQIENSIYDQNMERCTKIKTSAKQALDSDYVGSHYDRGHLFPFSLNGEVSARASCTLTNAVPENRTANVKWYNQAERVVKEMAKVCHNTGRRMYVVTGSADYNHGNMKNKVKIPGQVWTAACCTLPRNLNLNQNQNGRFQAEEVGTTRNPQTPNGEFSIAFKGTLFPTVEIVKVSVATLERDLNVRIFNQCKEATREIDEVVQRLLRHEVRDNNERKRARNSSTASAQIDRSV